MNLISYRWKLRKLHRSRAKTVEAYKRLQDNARKENKAQDELESLVHEEMFEIDMIDDDIESLESRFLIESARKLILPIPEFKTDGDAWVESRITGRYRLSKNAMTEVRTVVRKERKERREGMIMWLVALTGLVGALSGLLAVWKS